MYYTVFDANNVPYAYTPSETGARFIANEIGGYYREYQEGD